MTISDSLPIKFWLSSEEGYNEEQICGVFSDCFCEHVNFDENITLQFQHSEAITLQIRDMDDDSVLVDESIPSLGDGYYQITFKPNDLIDDDYKKSVYFTIADSDELTTALAFTECIIIGGCLEFPFPYNYTINIYNCGVCAVIIRTGVLTGDDALTLGLWYKLDSGETARVTGNTALPATDTLLDTSSYATCPSVPCE